MTQHCHDLYDSVKGSGRVRDVVLKEYVGQEHSGIATSATMHTAMTSFWTAFGACKD